VHFPSGLEKRYALVTDRHVRSSPRVSSFVRWPVFHRKRAETTQLGPVAAGERCSDLAENSVDEFLDVTLVELRVLRDNALNEFRLDHLVMPWPRKEVVDDVTVNDQRGSLVNFRRLEILELCDNENSLRGTAAWLIMVFRPGVRFVFGPLPERHIWDRVQLSFSFETASSQRKAVGRGRKASAGGAMVAASYLRLDRR
jgi:hypothetical protein